jgi:hypothetical protein
MEYKEQPLEIPKNCIVTRNVFTTYNPETDYSEEKSLCNLTEDLLHAEFKQLDLIIDLGWYGNFELNKGIFRILVIKGVDWDNPLMIQESTSQIDITKKLNFLLKQLSH